MLTAISDICTYHVLLNNIWLSEQNQPCWHSHYPLARLVLQKVIDNKVLIPHTIWLCSISFRVLPNWHCLASCLNCAINSATDSPLLPSAGVELKVLNYQRWFWVEIVACSFLNMVKWFGQWEVLGQQVLNDCICIHTTELRDCLFLVSILHIICNKMVCVTISWCTRARLCGLIKCLNLSVISVSCHHSTDFKGCSR